jgi:hypothetical protein
MTARCGIARERGLFRVRDREGGVVRHGEAAPEQVSDMLRSSEARRQHLAFDLLEASNPVKHDKAAFLAVLRFIWDATGSYDVCRDFVMRHPRMLVELQRDRLRLSRQQSGAPRTSFFDRLLQRH